MARVAIAGRLALLLLLPVGWSEGSFAVSLPVRDWEIGDLTPAFPKELPVDLPKKRSFRFIFTKPVVKLTGLVSSCPAAPI